MRLHTVLVALLQAALVQSFQEVHGFLGETVILPSGADPALNLTDIRWSIYSNITSIASWRDGKLNTERLNRFKGRLSLNTSTGDLTFCNINEKDAIEYTVKIFVGHKQYTNKVKLTVKQRLQKPTIKIFPKNDSCEVALYCFSPEKDLGFSWKVDPTIVSNVTFINGMNSAVLLASLSTTQSSVEFTCTANRSTESAWNTITYGCNATETDSDPVRVCPPPPPQSRSRVTAFFLVGIFIGFFLAFSLCALGGESKSSAS